MYEVDDATECVTIYQFVQFFGLDSAVYRGTGAEFEGLIVRCSLFWD